MLPVFDHKMNANPPRQNNKRKAYEKCYYLFCIVIHNYSGKKLSESAKV
jgi:hypothetical protein